ncbi:uncharacterized protein LOC132198780 isoform X2 [Neocloeon triangulifer]|uniref:uncharacterized protein LOC132198712 isoform X2 n=1 Tax=Neocloeon triangulifer TaxID=2078957 RepID=UPI00286F36C0|nr:uncharacterized protein LOC132198712 isoform X2 [Neocloeon triangulifer]XP_059478974.1 uncharacterized protein LOC132198780 isoform X2 [Neocloeon triangulifer]
MTQAEANSDYQINIDVLSREIIITFAQSKEQKKADKKTNDDCPEHCISELPKCLTEIRLKLNFDVEVKLNAKLEVTGIIYSGEKELLRPGHPRFPKGLKINFDNGPIRASG